MSVIVNIQSEIMDTSAMISRLERDIIDFPDYAGIKLEISSLEKRKAKLEKDFLDASNEIGLQVCNYRVISDDVLPTMGGLFGAVIGFQDVFSVVYDALKNGKKDRANLTPGTLAESSLYFGYSFSGSTGFALTVPRNSNLFGDSIADDSFDVIFQASKSRTADQINSIADRLGSAPIRLIYKWANSHTKHLYSAAIEWKQGTERARSFLVQVNEFAKLQSIISSVSEEQIDEVTVRGKLLAVHSTRQRFVFESDEGAVIAGDSGEVIDDDNKVVVPERYQAKLQKTTIVKFSTDEQKVDWKLLSLDGPRRN